MRKRIIILFLVLFYAIGGSLFALGVSEYPIQHNVYGQLALALPRDYGACITVGAGYEGALSKNFSLGGYVGMIAGEEIAGADILFNVKYYFLNSALENFFIGANIGLCIFGDQNDDTLVDFVVGLKAGYKFVFNNSFTVEPFLGYDLLAGDGVGGRFNVGVALGYGWIPTKKPESVVEPTPPPSGQPKDGIYLGIITFGPNAEIVTSEPIYLDAQGLARVNDLLDTKYLRDDTIGTALFYAAHLGLAEMKRAEPKLPQSLKHVAMITFTDGLDVSSTGLSLNNINDPGNTAGLRFAGEDIRLYQDFVKREIDNRRINGTGISAYIAAIRGDDVTNISAFEDALGSLSSSTGDDDYIRRPNSTTELDSMFTEIAGRVVSDVTISTLTVVTPEYPRNTRVRMTFNTELDAQEAQYAQMYLEGEVSIRNGQYYLINIVYNGIRSSAGTQLRGEREGSTVVYEFENFYGYDITRSETILRRELRQWYMNTGESEWQVNSEYGMVPVSIPNKVRNNTLVYLILDKSTSINQADLLNVRTAARRFVNMLYIYNQEENQQE